MLILLASHALALDCTGRDPDTCAAVNGLVPMVNAEVGSTLLKESGPARFKPSVIYTQLEAVRQAAGAGGCRLTASFEGWDGGRYDSAQGWFDGGWAELLGGAGDLAGDVDHPARTFDGGWTGTGSGAVGDVFARYNSIGQAAGNRGGDGFIAGRWVRQAGRRGVFVALHGDCDGSVGAAEGLDPWYDGDLAPPDPPSGTGAWAFDGVDDVVHLPLSSNPDLAAFTIEAWVRTTDPLGTIVEVYSSSPLGADRILYVDGGVACFYVYTPGFSITCGTTRIDDGAWHHVAGSLGWFDDQHLVVDGVAEGFAADVASAFSWGTQYLRVGHGYAGPFNGEQGLNGDIDEVRLWSVGRTHNEIFIFRDQVLLPGTPNLQGYWSFDAGTLVDDAGVDPPGSVFNTFPPFGPISPGAL